MQENKSSKIKLFGYRLKMVRKLLKLGQNDVSVAIGHSSYQSISRYERGERFPDKSTVALLVDCLNVSADWLLYGNVNKNDLFEIISTIILNEIKAPAAEISKRLSVSKDFIQAIIDGEVSPADKFQTKIMEKGFGIKRQPSLKDAVEQKVAQIKQSRKEVGKDEKIEIELDKLQEKLNDMYEQYFKLKKDSDEEIARLRRRIVELEKVLGEKY